MEIKIENCIKDNRIVGDKTFAIRFLNFVLGLQWRDQWGEEEAMITYATELLGYQIQTASDKDEIDYLDRCSALKVLQKGRDYIAGFTHIKEDI